MLIALQENCWPLRMNRQVSIFEPAETWNPKFCHFTELNLFSAVRLPPKATGTFDIVRGATIKNDHLGPAEGDRNIFLNRLRPFITGVVFFQGFFFLWPKAPLNRRDSGQAPQLKQDASQKKNAVPRGSQLFLNQNRIGQVHQPKRDC